MAANTIPFQSIWVKEYQATHYKQAVFPMFADERFENKLVQGASVKWSYDADMGVGRMAADGGYSLGNRTITDETLTVDQRPYAGFNIPTTEKIQDHRPTQQKWATKSMNAIYQDVDGVILKQLKTGASSSLSAADFGGTSGDPITVSTSNAAAIYAASRRVLKNQNILYDMNKKFRNVVSFDAAGKFPVAAIPAELEEKLLLQIGFKNTEGGDETLKQGYLGAIFGFNTVTSSALPFSFRYTLTATPTNTTTLTLGSGSSTVGSGTSLGITWVTSIGSTVGNVLAETNAATSVANLVAFLNDIYEATSSPKYVGFDRTALSIAQTRIADNLSAVDNLDGSCVITIGGQGAVTVAQTDTAGTIDRQAVHAIFGTSESVAVIFQKKPELEVSAGMLVTTGQLSGYAAQHFLTWTLYGSKVFQTQAKQLVNVPIACSTFTSPASTIL